MSARSTSGVPSGKGAARVVGASAPISIPVAIVRAKSRAASELHSASVPAAPLIGSLKAPAHLEHVIPDLSLPEASPAGYSMVCVRGLVRRIWQSCGFCSFSETRVLQESILSSALA